MVAPGFTKLDAALDSAKRSVPKADEDKLTELLQLTAGTGSFEVDSEIKLLTVYRPYYVAARWLRQNFNHIIKSSGVVGAQKVDPAEAIADLIDMQAAEDERLGLVVPAGYRAVSQTLPTGQGASPVFAGVAR